MLTVRAKPSAPPERRVGSPLATALAYLVSVVIILVTVVPLLFIFIGGFRTTPQINRRLRPGCRTPGSGRTTDSMITSRAFWHFLLNSAMIAVVTTTLAVTLGSMAAFALSRYTFKGREALFSFFTIGLLFPLTVASLPLYLLLRHLGLLENMFGVAIPEAAFSLSITIVILRPFMRAIPGELEDAAVIDGTTKLGFFWRVLLPLSAPALTTVAILAFVTSWNFFILPLLVFNNQIHFTLPLGVASFQSQYSADTARVFAFTALSMLPALIFFTLAQRRIVGGLAGAVKG